MRAYGDNFDKCAIWRYEPGTPPQGNHVFAPSVSNLASPKPAMRQRPPADLAQGPRVDAATPLPPSPPRCHPLSVREDVERITYGTTELLGILRI